MKTAERKSIVEKRWQARQVFDTAINAMPETITVYNRGGERDRREESLDETLENLEEIKRLVFNRNTNQHYVAVSCDNPRMISYARDTDHKFSSKRRVKTTWQKYILKHFPDREFHAKALDLFVSKFQSEVSTDVSCFKEVTGDELLYYFEQNWGGSSCMTGEEHQDYIQIYAKNPNIVSLIVYHDPDSSPCKGRALLWHLENLQFMDRIYPNEGPHIEKFYAYAKKKGMEIRGWNGYPDDCPGADGDYPRVPVGEDGNLSFSVKLKAARNGYMPYMDSFHYGYSTSYGWVAKTDSNCGSCDRVFNSTSGDANDFPRWACDCCGTPITESSADGSGYCDSCYEEHTEFNCCSCESAYYVSEQRHLPVYRIRWRHHNGEDSPRVPTTVARREHMGSEVCSSCYEEISALETTCDCCNKHFDVAALGALSLTFPDFSAIPDKTFKSQLDIQKFVQREWVRDNVAPERIQTLGGEDEAWSHNFSNMCWDCWADKLEYYGFRLNRDRQIPINNLINDSGTWLFSYEEVEALAV